MASKTVTRSMGPIFVAKGQVISCHPVNRLWEWIWHKHKIIALRYWSWEFSGMLAQINAKEFSRNYWQWLSRILEKSQDFGEKFRTYGFGIDRGSASKIGWAPNKTHLKLGRILYFFLSAEYKMYKTSIKQLNRSWRIDFSVGEKTCRRTPDIFPQKLSEG